MQAVVGKAAGETDRSGLVSHGFGIFGSPEAGLEQDWGPTELLQSRTYRGREILGGRGWRNGSRGPTLTDYGLVLQTPHLAWVVK